MNFRRLAFSSLTALCTALAVPTLVCAQEKGPENSIRITTGNQLDPLCSIVDGVVSKSKGAVILAVQELCENRKAAFDANKAAQEPIEKEYQRSVAELNAQYKTTKDAANAVYAAAGKTIEAWKVYDKEDTEAWAAKDKQETLLWIAKDKQETAIWVKTNSAQEAIFKSRFPNGILISFGLSGGPN